MEPTKEDLAIERAYIDQDVFVSIKTAPGVTFAELRDCVEFQHDRVLDRSLQRLRRKGLIRYEGGGWRVL